MASNLSGSARAGVVGVIDPDAYAAGTYTTGWIDMAKLFAVLAVIMAGDLGASATLDAKFQQATDGAGTGAKDVTGSSIAQLTQAGADDNKQVLINLTPADLDFNHGYRFVRLSLTVGAAASDVGAVVIGLDPRFGAATDNDSATVDEVVA